MIFLRRIRKIIFLLILLSISLYAHAPGERPFCFYSGKKVYYPQHAGNNGKAEWIKNKLSEYVKFPAYQKRCGITFCNVFARDIIDCRTKKRGKVYCFYFDDFRYDISAVFPRKNDIFMNIKKAYRRAKQALKKKLIVSYSCKEAQIQANKGNLIWGVSAKYNHEFLVCPGNWSDHFGCMVAQAGEVNGIFRISDKEVFGKNWEDPEIKYYEFQEK